MRQCVRGGVKGGGITWRSCLHTRIVEQSDSPKSVHGRNHRHFLPGWLLMGGLI